MDPAAKGNQALMSAIPKGQVGAVKLLLADNKVDPAANDNSAIQSLQNLERRMISERSQLLKLRARLYRALGGFCLACRCES